MVQLADLLLFTALVIPMLGLVAALAAAAAKAMVAPPDVAALKDQILERWHIFVVSPEPVERFAYIATILSVVPVSLLCIALVRRMPTDWARGISGSRIAIGWSVVSLALFVLALQQPFMRAIILGPAPASTARNVQFLLILGVAAVVASACIFWRARNLAAISPISARAAINIFLSVLIVFVFGLLRLRSADMFAGDLHFDAVLYPVAQVAAGRTLLADLPAQYGLYAELLAPLFKPIGLSVLKFTALLAFLQVCAGLSLLAAANLLIRLDWLRLVAMLFLLVFVGSMWLVVIYPSGYEYPQIWPIRLLFTALALLLFVRFRRHGLDRRAVGILATVAGIAILWNLDTGIPVAGALIAVPLANVVFGPRAAQSRNLKLLTVGIALPVAISAAFACYLWVKSGGQANFADLLKYQRIFYASGFGMLPMPLSPHPWMAVFAIYLLAFGAGLIPKVNGRSSTHTDSLLFLAVLGFGLFTYYQGRSHDTVLSFVLWPAVLIAFILADRMLRGARAGLLPRQVRFAALPVVTLGLASGYVWIAGVPNLIGAGINVTNSIAHRDETATAATVSFIRSHMGEDREAVIIDRAQAVLYAETGLASAIPGPGLVEILLKSDFDHLIQALRSRRVSHVFIGPEPDGSVPSAYGQALESYRLAARTERMLYFVPAQ